MSERDRVCGAHYTCSSRGSLCVKCATTSARPYRSQLYIILLCVPGILGSCEVRFWAAGCNGASRRKLFKCFAECIPHFLLFHINHKSYHEVDDCCTITHYTNTAYNCWLAVRFDVVAITCCQYRVIALCSMVNYRAAPHRSINSLRSDWVWFRIGGNAKRVIRACSKGIRNQSEMSAIEFLQRIIVAIYAGALHCKSVQRSQQ